MNGWELYWRNQRNKLKREFEAKGITRCEVGLPGCFRDNFLSFAHYKKRRYYYSKKELLGDFYQVLLCCTPCHAIIEDSKELTAKYFYERRGEETFKAWGEEVPRVEGKNIRWA